MPQSNNALEGCNQPLLIWSGWGKVPKYNKDLKVKKYKQKCLSWQKHRKIAKLEKVYSRWMFTSVNVH